VNSTLAQAKKQLLSLQKQSVRDAQTDQERETAKHNKLLARQAALPVANINLPGYCFILNAYMFMVELKDHKLHPMITLANQRKERRYKQTGYSRYGEHMQEHYLIAKYTQMELRGDEPGTPSGAPNQNDSSDSA